VNQTCHVHVFFVSSQCIILNGTPHPVSTSVCVFYHILTSQVVPPEINRFSYFYIEDCFYSNILQKLWTEMMGLRIELIIILFDDYKLYTFYFLQSLILKKGMIYLLYKCTIPFYRLQLGLAEKKPLCAVLSL